MKVYIGTPPQEMELLLDINRPYIQVDDNFCLLCTTSNRFETKDSESYKTERSLKIEGAEAKLGQDSLLLGPDKHVQVNNQTLVVMKSHNPTDYQGGDGILVTLR